MSTFSVTPELKKAVEDALLERGKWKKIAGRNQIEFRCIADDHPDNNPSAHYNPLANVWKCRSCGAGGGILDICRRLGIDWQNLQPVVKRERPKPQPGQTPVATYTYRHKDGHEFRKLRYEFPERLTSKGKPEKIFEWTPRFPEGVSVGDMDLFWSFPRSERPNDPIVFVEGEEVVKALRARGILAVCGAWGASQRTFGPALAEMQGAEIWLSPDNDMPGNDYMHAIEAELRSRRIPALNSQGKFRIRHVRVPLGEGEDLADFFRKGGNVEDIWKGDFSEPQVTFHSPDHIGVTVGHGPHIIAFDATNIRRSRDVLSCRLATCLTSQPGAETFYQRINLLSSSSRTALERALMKMFETDKSLNWTQVMNQLCALLEQAYVSQENGIDLYVVEPGEEKEQWLIPGLLPLNQPTIFFGDGESLKTMVALRCAISVAYGFPFLDLDQAPAVEGKVLYIDYENMTDRGLRRRLSRLTAGIEFPLAPDCFRYWNGRGAPLIEQADLIEQEIRRNNIQFVVLDSAIPSLGGGDPNDAAQVSALFDAISAWKVTPLIISHEAKSDAHARIAAWDRRPYGSVQWHNLARRTFWFSRGDVFTDADHVELAVVNCKANEGQRLTPLAFQVDFWNDEGLPIQVQRKDWSSVNAELDRLRPWILRLTDALKGGQLSVTELATRLRASNDTVSKHLRHYPDRFVNIHDEDGKGYWGLKAV